MMEMKVYVRARFIPILALVLILSFQHLTEAAVSCTPAEEGTIANAVCDSSFNSHLVWLLVDVEGHPQKIITCTNSTCTSTLPTRYSATVHNGSQGSTLTVTDFSRELYTWMCRVDGRGIKLCYIWAYVKPEAPTCNSPSLVADGSRVTVTCSTDRVFPQALCQFFSRVNSSSPWTLRQRDVTYNHTSRSESDKEYFRSECTLEVAVTDLGPGSHTFRAVMYPDFFRSSPTTYGVTSGDSGVLTLSLPTVAKDATCPQGSDVIDGYIKNGTQASCRCNIAHLGNPPGQVTWYNSGGQEVGIQAADGKSSVIDFVFSNPGSDYTCRANSSLGQGSPVTFRPNIAYGPTDVAITTNNNLNFDLCPGRSLSVTCLVALGAVNPEPLFTVLQNNSRLADSHRGSENSSSYGYTHTLFLTGGDLLVRCRADNSKFSDLAVATALVKVREPPPSAPVITIAGQEFSGTGQLWLTENETASVQCRVDGGVPVVSDVTVSCPSALTNDLAVVTRSQDKTKCTCSATHVTNCYQKTSDVTVNVAYGPDSVTITRDKGTQPHNLCPGSDDDEVITCSVPTSEVNPDPQFSAMVSPGLASAWGSAGGGAGPHAWTYQFKPVQGGLHRVRCLARNSRSQRQVTSRDLEFEVREPPPSKPRIVIENSLGEATLLEGDDVMITCFVDGGFPLVTSSDMTLTCTSSDGLIEDTGENATIAKSNVSMAVNGTQCACTATHVSQCYQETTVKTIFIQNFTNSRSEKSSDTSAAAIGGGIAAAVIIVVVIIAVYCFIKRKASLYTSPNIPPPNSPKPPPPHLPPPSPLSTIPLPPPSPSSSYYCLPSDIPNPPPHLPHPYTSLRERPQDEYEIGEPGGASSNTIYQPTCLRTLPRST